MNRAASRGAALAALALPLAAVAAAQQRPYPATEAPARAEAEAPAGAEPDGRRGGAALRVLDVPFVPQSEALCGGAAVSMVLRYWGERDVRAEDFAHLVTRDGRGIPAGRLVAAAERRGWTPLAFAGDRAELRRQVERGRPAVVLLEVRPGRYHYVVVVASWDEATVYHDPARAPWRVETAAEFDRAWAAAGHWALVLVPGSDREGGRREATVATGRSIAGPTPAAGAADAATADPSAADPSAGSCDSPREIGARLAGRGRLAEAEALLAHVAASCASPRGRGDALRELAGVRLRQGRWKEAERLASGALRLNPADAHALETVATARYMAGEDEAALAAWADAGRSSVDLIRVSGLGRTRHRAVTRLLGLEPARPLTLGGLQAARRRLDLLPAAAATRLAYRPVGDGRVEVRAAVLERPLAPTSTPAVAALGLRALAASEAAATVAGPTGAGEAWRVAWRWSSARPGLEISAAVPARLGVPGVWRIAGSWERERWAGYGAAGPLPGGGRPLEGTRRAATVGLESWATGWLRWRGRIGLERWGLDAGGTESDDRLAVAAEVEARALGDRLSAAVTLSAWPALDTGEGAAVARTDADLRWRSASRTEGTVLHGRLGTSSTSSGAPPFLWPGAGTGRARPALARAHPLVRDGAIGGPALGPRLVHGGVELVRWLAAPGAGPGPGFPAGLGVAAFADAAEASGLGGPMPLLIDAGVGGRLALGGLGLLRVDVARGLADGATAFSLGWEDAWPGRPGR